MESMLLHWDVIQEILLRLPVKSLVRFKRVCKSWHSLISDPHFAKSHYELSAAPSHKLLYTASLSEARSIDFDAPLHHDSSVASLILPLLKPGKHGPRLLIVGSCRGYVLMERYPDLYIWNPSTGFHRELSYPEEHQSVNVRLTGFGYDPSTDDYLVVVLVDKDAFYDGCGHRVKRLVLFSLRTNLWKEIQGSHPPYLNASPFQSFFCNDAVHWLSFRSEPFERVILAFDLEKKNFYEISLPDVDFNDRFPLLRLVIMGECLGLCYHGRSKTNVCVMKEYKVQSSWTMLEIPTHLSAVCVAKGGELIGLRFRNKKGEFNELMKFSVKGELLERCEFYFDCRMGYSFGMYTESLLSLSRDYDGSMETPSTEIGQKNRNV